MVRSTLARMAAATLCAAALATMQATPANAAGRVDKKISMTFSHTLETSTWTQKYGTTSLTITKCRMDYGAPFYATLMRSVVGPDVKMEGHDMTCRNGLRAFYSVPVNGTFYFRFTRAEDSRWVDANATISYPR